jgi:hypothetical protein
MAKKKDRPLRAGKKELQSQRQLSPRPFGLTTLRPLGSPYPVAATSDDALRQLVLASALAFRPRPRRVRCAPFGLVYFRPLPWTSGGLSAGGHGAD